MEPPAAARYNDANNMPNASDRVGGRRWRSDAAFLVAVTVVAGLLRFAALGRPTLWNDEVLTYSRVCGTHAQMMDLLKDDGFGPLHYEIYWLMARVLPMTPFQMRVVPALAGTAMVPAVFLLAAELFADRRVARLAMVFAAGSAFLLAYSRDAKMYMELWLAITLHAGLLLTALRTGKRWAWAAWWVAGSTAVWLHAGGLLLVPLDLLVLLLHRRGTVMRTAVAAALLAAMLAGPAWYVATVSRVPTAARKQGWEATGIGWVGGRTAGHATASLVADTAAAFAFAFSWVEEPLGTAVPPVWVAITAVMLLAGLAVVLGLAWMAGPSRVPTGLSASADSGTVNGVPLSAEADSPVGPTARTFLLLAWIGLPLYATYRLSRAREPSFTAVVSTVGGAITAAVAVGLTAWLGLRVARGRSRSRVVNVAKAALGLAAGGWAARAVLADPVSPVRLPGWASGEVAAAVMTTAILVAVVGGVALMLGRDLTRPAVVRLIAIAVAVVVLIAAVDRAADASAAGSVWMPRYLAVVYPAVLIAVAAALIRLPWPAVRWATVGLLLVVNLAQAAAHVLVANEPPVDRVMADVAAAADPATAVFAGPPNGSSFGPHGAGSVYNTVGRYYLMMATGRRVSPAVFRTRPGELGGPYPWLSTDAYTIKNAVDRNPRLARLVVWDRPDRPAYVYFYVTPTTTPAARSTGVARSLQRRLVPMAEVLPDWHAESTDVYPVRQFWDWGTLYPYRRTVYVRTTPVPPR